MKIDAKQQYNLKKEICNLMGENTYPYDGFTLYKIYRHDTLFNFTLRLFLQHTISDDFNAANNNDVVYFEVMIRDIDQYFTIMPYLVEEKNESN